jgi:hypothetical protein
MVAGVLIMVATDMPADLATGELPPPKIPGKGEKKPRHRSVYDGIKRFIESNADPGNRNADNRRDDDVNSAGESNHAERFTMAPKLGASHEDERQPMSRQRRMQQGDGESGRDQRRE